MRRCGFSWPAPIWSGRKAGTTFWSGLRRPTVRQHPVAAVGKALVDGTPNGIRMDPESGLIFSPAHFTWMDTNYPAGTPREGYPIEIQALWFAALTLLARIDPAGAEWQGSWPSGSQTSILTLFFPWRAICPTACMPRPAHRRPAGRSRRCPAAEPAAGHHIGRRQRRCRSAAVFWRACEALLVPGAIRSLADRPLRRPLADYPPGQLFNDPHHPYQGYAGDEEPAAQTGLSQRYGLDLAVSQLLRSLGAGLRRRRQIRPGPGWPARLAAGARLRRPYAGNPGRRFSPPQRGCDAQAWGVSELVRVWLQLSK